MSSAIDSNDMRLYMCEILTQGLLAMRMESKRGSVEMSIFDILPDSSQCKLNADKTIKCDECRNIVDTHSLFKLLLLSSQ